MEIIGIAGRAGAGKSTVAGIVAGLLNAAGCVVAIDSFGTGIKRAAREIGWAGQKDEYWRGVLQQIGEDGRRENPAKWVVELCLRWANSPAAVDFLIIPDVRCEDEAIFCRAQGVLWFVSGRGGLTGAGAQHPTEAFDWPRCADDVRIDNGGSVVGLYCTVQELLASRSHWRRRWA